MQICVAALLGTALGFVPGFFLPGDLGAGFLQAPGLILTLIGSALILNCSLMVFGLCALGAKLLALVALPVSFSVGRALLDGPVGEVLEPLIAMPVLAWFGLEYYATTGGLAVGLVLGAVIGWLLQRALRSFRSVMANLEDGSERYGRLRQKRSLRFATWLLLGKRPKQTYRELLQRPRRAWPVRLTGVVAVVASVGVTWFAHSLVGGSVFRGAVQRSLEHWNGATVDLAGAALDLAGGRVSLEGLAVADANQLDRDQFRANMLELDLDSGALLARRFVLDRVVSRACTSGEPRAKRARRTILPPRSTPDRAPDEQPAGQPDKAKPLQHYLREAERWQARLQQADRWLGWLVGGDGSSSDTTRPAEARIAESVQRQVEALGRARAVAIHRLTRAPRLLIRELAFEGLHMAGVEDLLDVRAENVSSNPALVSEPLTLSIVSRSGRFGFEFRQTTPGRPAETRFHYKDLPVDAIASELRASPVRGGKVDLALGGHIDLRADGGLHLDLPLRVTLRQTTLSLSGMQPTPVDELTVPIGVRGPLSAPTLFVDDATLVDALLASGKRELADRVGQRASALLDQHAPAELKGLVPGDSTLSEAQKRAAAELAKQREAARDEAARKATEELNKHLPGGAGGLFGDSKKQKKD